MTKLYAIHCPACGYETSARPAAAFAVLVTGPAEDRLRRRRLAPPVVLHPAVGYVFDEFGLSFATAARGGFLVEVTAAVCLDCGRPGETRRLTAGGVRVGCGGCLAVAGVGAAAGIIGGTVADNPFVGFGVGTAAGVFALTAVELGADVIVTWRFPARAAAVAGRGECGACGGRRLRRLDRVAGPVPCRQCGGAARVRASG